MKKRPTTIRNLSFPFFIVSFGHLVVSRTLPDYIVHPRLLFAYSPSFIVYSEDLCIFFLTLSLLCIPAEGTLNPCTYFPYSLVTNTQDSSADASSVPIGSSTFETTMVSCLSEEDHACAICCAAGVVDVMQSETEH